MNQHDFHYPITATILIRTTEGASAETDTPWATVDDIDRHLYHLIEEPDIESASAVVTASPHLTELRTAQTATSERIAAAEKAGDDATVVTLIDEYYDINRRINDHQLRNID